MNTFLDQFFIKANFPTQLSQSMIVATTNVIYALEVDIATKYLIWPLTKLKINWSSHKTWQNLIWIQHCTVYSNFMFLVLLYLVMDCDALIDCVKFQTLKKPLIQPVNNTNEQSQKEFIVYRHGLTLKCHHDRPANFAVIIGWQTRATTFHKWVHEPNVNTTSGTLKLRDVSYPHQITSSHYRCYTFSDSDHSDLQISSSVQVIFPCEYFQIFFVSSGGN